MSELIVIGGGIVGLSVAVQARRRGHDVVVFEARTVASGASWGNAGWIVPALSSPVSTPENLAYVLRSLLDPHAGFAIHAAFDPGIVPWGIRFALASRRSRVEQATRVTARWAQHAHRSFADLVSSGVTVAPQRSGMLVVHADHGAAQTELRSARRLAEFGIDVADEVLDTRVIERLAPALGRAAHAGVHYPGQQYVDPGRFTLALADLARREGVQIREGSVVDRLVRRERPLVRLRSGEEVTAADLVIAAGNDSRRLARQLGYRLPMQPGRGYSVTVRPRVGLDLAVYIPRAKTALTPFGRDIRIAGVMELGGGRRSLNPRRALDPRRRERMRASAEGFFADDFELDEGAARDVWAGSRTVTADGLPVIGALPTSAHTYIATGHSMLGMTLGPLTGEAVAAMIDGERSALLAPFRPERFR